MIPVLLKNHLYYEPFVAFIPEKHKLFVKEKINVDDLFVNDLLLLKEGHCLREQTLKVCRTSEKEWRDDHNKILFEFGSLDTLINLVQQNFGITLLPYLSTKYMKDDAQLSLVREFNTPVPKREIGLVYGKSFIKKHLIQALKKEILSMCTKGIKK